MRLAPGRFLLALILGVTAVLVVAGTSIGETAKVKATGSQGDFKWKPAKRTIVEDDKVLWKNPTSADHTVTAYSDNWDVDVRLDPGDRLRIKFAGTGTYKYRCKLHSTLSNGECSGMCGRVKATS